MPQVTPPNQTANNRSPQDYQKDPIALLWIIVGLLSAVATFMGILTLVPKYQVLGALRTWCAANVKCPHG